MRKIAVIGGGASGFAAAITAARAGKKVTIFERQAACLRKVTASGNGQCNIANSNPSAEFYHGDSLFAEKVIESAGLNKTIEFFSSMGIVFREGKSGKLYPYSFQSSAVVDSLLAEAERLGIEIKTHSRIDSITTSKSSMNIETASKQKHVFDSVILSPGSESYPQLGGCRDGYDLARKCSHSITEIIPSIVPINLSDKYLRRLEGVKWDSVLRVRHNDSNVYRAVSRYFREAQGELLFTKYGISGPVTLDISQAVNKSVSKKENVIIEIDFFPDMKFHQLEEFLTEYIVPCRLTTVDALSRVLKKRMPEAIIHAAEVFSVDLFERPVLKKIIPVLKGLQVSPADSRAMSDAMVCAGGINTDEINPATMESLKMKGLFITGEVLNVDGDTGGFNLQFAWSGGIIAGQNC